MITFDNTTLADFKRCMRYGYYRHVRGWVEYRINPALLFGVAWHAAMSAIWAKKPETAYEAFLGSWVEGGGPTALSAKQTREYGSRTLQTARKMLTEYVAQRADDVSRATVVSDEEFFLTEIADDIYYCGTTDKVLKTPGWYVVLDHKTTSCGTPSGFSSDWIEGWRLSAQMFGYVYATRQNHPGLPVSAVIDAALVSNRGMSFDYIPVRPTKDQTSAWLYHTKALIFQILDDWKAIGFPPAGWTDVNHQYFLKLPERNVLEEFPLNTESCVKYGKRCPYWNLCVHYNQPEDLKNPPKGFVKRYWRPQDDKTE